MRPLEKSTATQTLPTASCTQWFLSYDTKNMHNERGGKDKSNYFKINFFLCFTISSYIHLSSIRSLRELVMQYASGQECNRSMRAPGAPENWSQYGEQRTDARMCSAHLLHSYTILVSLTREWCRSWWADLSTSISIITMTSHRHAHRPVWSRQPGNPFPSDSSVFQVDSLIPPTTTIKTKREHMCTYKAIHKCLQQWHSQWLEE